MKIILSAVLIFLGGCETIAQHQTMRTADGRIIKTANYSQDTHQASLVEESRQACYAAIVDIEANKARTNPALIAMIERPSVSEQGLMMVAMMIENNKLVGNLLNEAPPITCNNLNQYEYKLAVSEVRHKFWGGLAGNVLKYGTAAFLGHELIGGLARDTVTAGSGALINRGNGTIDTSDNRDLSTTITNPAADASAASEVVE